MNRSGLEHLLGWKSSRHSIVIVKIDVIVIHVEYFINLYGIVQSGNDFNAVHLKIEYCYVYMAFRPFILEICLFSPVWWMWTIVMVSITI